MLNKFKCFLIGEGSLLIQCSEILLNKGHEILGIFSGNNTIAGWALEKQINLYRPDSDMISVLESQAYDYLFSVANLSILPAKVINSASKMAVNFHDGPLPGYAGINATSWALINNEKIHGITWHRITPEIDEGSILNQTLFDVSPDETAFTLNTKCYEAGAASFSKLVDELTSGTFTETEQSSGSKTYFAKHQKPESAGIISWKRAAVEISSLVRALNFGQYPNPLASAKIWINGEIVIVKGAKAIDSINTHKAGLITDHDPSSITISTARGLVVLNDFETVTGKKITVEEILSRHNLAAGSSLSEPDDEWKKNLTDYYASVCRNESYFIEKLKQFEPIDIPFKTKKLNGSAKFKSLKLETDDKIKDHIKSYPEYDFESFIKSSFALYAGRLQSRDCYDIGYMQDTESAGITAFRSLFAETVPLHIEINYQGKVSEQIIRTVKSINKIKNLKTYIYDLIERTPELKNSGTDYSEFPVVIQDGIISESKFSSGSKLTLFYSYSDKQFYFVYDEAELSSENMYRIKSQFEEFIVSLICSYQDDFYKTSVLTSEERDTLLKVFNNTGTAYDKNICIHHLFEEQVKTRPNAVAVVSNGSEITFDELNKKADQLANYLLSKGIEQNSFVGISMNRSINMITAILGVLKSGGAYVPIDPYFPKDRIDFMIKDSDCPLIITESAFKNNFELSDSALVFIDTEWEQISKTESQEIFSHKPSGLAYVIYTSGSTGKPKGVMVSHRNVVNFFTGIDQHIKYNGSSVWLAVTSLSFDISVLELLWTLTRGVKVVLYTGDDLKISAKSDKAVVSSQKIDFSLFYFSSYEGEKSENKYKLLIDGARFGDKNDFAAIWTPERHFYDFGGLYANPSITSAAISTITEKIKIRAGSVVSPLHSTIRIAEEWSMVDNLSQGRVAIAFAAGWQQNDFVIMPQNFEDRKNIMFRQVEEIQKLWQGNSVAFKNPVGKMIDIQILPKPVQKKLPVWITAAGNPETFEMAGKAGYNLLTHLLGQTTNEVAEKIKVYRNAWKEAGHEGEGKITLMLHTFVGSDERSVKETVREPMKNYLRSAVNLVKEAAWSFPTFKQATTNAEGNFSMDQLSAVDLDAILDYSFERYYQSSGLFRPPESCLSIVEELKAVGVDEIACLIDFGIDSEIVLAHLHYLNQLRMQSNKKQISSEIDHEKYSVGALIKKHNITHLQCTPSMAQMLLLDEASASSLSSLQTLLIGGEVFPAKLAENLTASVKGEIFNMYGPTETTVWSTIYKLKKPVEKSIPVGIPIANTQVYILDNYRQLVSTDITGELYIGGDGVTEGYFNRPELTAEKYIDNPFSDESGSRLYRTGDIAYRGKDGIIEFIGRSDYQVKIRGYRIEPGEIENILLLHPGIREAAVIAKEDISGDIRLIAYLILKNGKSTEISEIRKFLKGKLPDYMIPAQYMFIDSFPLTPNGKVNRKAFPDPVQDVYTDIHKDFLLPANDLEKKIAAVWEDLLKLPKVGINDNFFDLGGHSLLAVQLHAKLKEIVDPGLTLIDIFTYPTISSLEEFVNKKLKANGKEITETAGTVHNSKRGVMSKQRIEKMKSRKK